ncbi:exonuclease 1, partial [Lecanoromycetidae sp. Uapishka_2]
MLIHFGILPYIVFDGDYLPSKAATEVDRAKRREESKRKGLELYRLNKPSQAHLELQKAIDVTPEMARQLIDELKKIGVNYVVAPYEADAQLAYLERSGIIQGMLSEDSDLLVFGAKRLLTKLDQYGDCVEINRADFTACRDISLVGWSDAEFRRMAILSGCDYLASINKMGLKTAYRYVRKYKTIEKILQMLQFDGQYHVPAGYLQAFYKAELTFLHQRVFCPVKNDIVMLTDIVSEVHSEDLSFIGHAVEREIALGVAKGDLDPMTKQQLNVKSAIKTTPKTPWQGSQRSTVETISDAKANKSIESFFRAKRTPLAELDPNSFTPSPTQERLLQQASGTRWESSPAPIEPPHLRSNRSLPSSAPRPALSAMASESVNSTPAKLSRPAPPKRRRLCLESEDSEHLGNALTSEVGRSRFFTANVPDPSPSMNITAKNRRKKQADITIWSDDSIEDIMSELQDAGESTKSSMKSQLEVFRDEDREEPETFASTVMRIDETPEVDSKSSTASKETVNSGASISTSATSSTSSTPTVAQTLNKHIKTELATLSYSNAYQPETERMAMQRREIGVAKGALQFKSSTQPLSKPLLQRRGSMTPLQRLGVGALNRSHSCGRLTNSAVHTPKKADTLMSSQGIIRTVPPMPSLPNAHNMGNETSTAKGSEDAIIPDSEESTDDGAIQSDVELAKPKIDLGRFAFRG